MRSSRMCLCLAAVAIAFVTGANLPADEPVLPGDLNRGVDANARTAGGLDREQAQLLNQWADKLASELEIVMEDISQGDQPEAKLYEKIDSAMHAATHFQKSLRPDSSREHIYVDFAELDKEISSLLQSGQLTNDVALRRGIARIGYAEQQLHQAISRGDVSAAVRTDSLTRQARALVSESRQLADAARIAPGDNRPSEQMRDAIVEFAELAEHFDKAVEKEPTRKHVLHDFEILNESWQSLVTQLNQFSGINAYLFRRAQRVNAIHNQLHRLLESETKRAPLEYRSQN